MPKPKTEFSQNIRKVTQTPTLNFKLTNEVSPIEVVTAFEQVSQGKAAAGPHNILLGFLEQLAPNSVDNLCQFRSGGCFRKKMPKICRNQK